ncbi:aryl-alcohol dehydrogenase-like predicted oxidoreductase [Catenulispora sp. GAS73]|uniref:aldo/keto reductase n=1 Tax=Catenulispora sp. GAS73 TaxID=3156269 RepID=UPI00351902E3
MMHRPLGGSGITVSAMGMGCWAVGGPFWTGTVPNGWGKVDDDESVRVIHRALELGVTLFDTADVYGAGHGERVLGKALRGHRDAVVVATKWGNRFDEDTRQVLGTDGSPGYIRRALTASLARLGTDYIDLYQLHLNDLPVKQAMEMVETLEELVAEGLIRSYGWSTDHSERAAAWSGIGAHYAAVQHPLSVLRDAPTMLGVCSRSGLASLNREPLAMGLLSGKYRLDSAIAADDVRSGNHDWLPWFRDSRPVAPHVAMVAELHDVLTAGGRSLAQGALAWIWARSPATVPIPGCRTISQIEDNARALEFGAFDEWEFAEVQAVYEAGLPGARD